MGNLDGLNRELLTDGSKDTTSMMKNKKPKTSSTHPKRKRIIKIVLIVIGIFLVIYAVPTILLIKDAIGMQKSAKSFSAAFKDQNLDDVKTSSVNTRTSLKKIERDLTPFQPLRIVPVIGWYVSDAYHLTQAAEHGLNAVDIATNSLTPYADLLGLKGKNIGQAGTAQERMQLLVNTLQKITPQFDQIAGEFTVVQKEIDYVNPRRYPGSLFGLQIGQTLAETRTTIDQLGGLMGQAKPLLQALPSIMGSDTPKTYVVLFQNDKELRPSGGFLTAFTYITVNKGLITASGSSDIYTLDTQIQRVCLHRQCFELRPPSIIVKYLPEPTGQAKTALGARDSNYYPDYVASALEFKKLYDIVNPKQIDGIIAVDTHVVQDLLTVTGPIKVPGYPQAFDKDNVINLMMAYTNDVATGKNDRKAMLGDLMQSVLAFVSDAGRDKMQPLLTTSIDLLNQKHVLVYLYDQQAQDAIERFNWSGRIKSYPNTWDYLYINDANFASGKANLYVTENVEQKVEEKDGGLVKTVTIHYSDPQGYNDFLNRNYRDDTRVYVPQGSTLISVSGTQNGKDVKFNTSTYDEFGKTVFDTFVFTYAKGKTDITLQYKLPDSIQHSGEYDLLLQKQPGTTGNVISLDILGHNVKFGPSDSQNVLTMDQEIKVKL